MFAGWEETFFPLIYVLHINFLLACNLYYGIRLFPVVAVQT